MKRKPIKDGKKAFTKFIKKDSDKELFEKPKKEKKFIAAPKKTTVSYDNPLDDVIEVGEDGLYHPKTEKDSKPTSKKKPVKRVPKQNPAKEFFDEGFKEIQPNKEESTSDKKIVKKDFKPTLDNKPFKKELPNKKEFKPTADKQPFKKDIKDKKSFEPKLDNKPFKKDLNDKKEFKPTADKQPFKKEFKDKKSFEPKLDNKPFKKDLNDKKEFKSTADKQPFKKEFKDKKSFEPKLDNQPFSKFIKKNPAQELFYEDFEEQTDEMKAAFADKKPFEKEFDNDKFSKNKFSKDKTSKNTKAFEKKQNNAPSSHDAPVEEDMRLNKYIAHSGLCSRRKAGEHIQNGAVLVNDIVVKEMGYKVQDGDVVKFQGVIVKPTTHHVYILLNKPKNVITTLEDENGRKTVMSFVADITKERVYPVGRLDRNTTGLLILTNDGQFAQKISHPSFEVKKVYKAKLDKPLTEEHMDMIRNTITLDDGPAPIVAIEYGDTDDIIGIELHIGRNRIVRRIFEHLGYEVIKLDRVFYGGLTKKDLAIGKCRFLTKQEIVILKHLA